MESQLMYLFFLCVFSVVKSQQSQLSNIAIGSKLYTNSTPNFWPSPSGRFAFGFYPNGNGFKVGIWLFGVPENTIVWTARRDDIPVSDGTALLIYYDGRLILQNVRGQLQPLSRSTQGASYGSMLDTGNFILYDSRFRIVWASFDYPTDTLLVGQRLVQKQFLYSSASKTNHSTGKFQVWMQNDGNLVAYPLNNDFNGAYAYWSTDTKLGGPNVSLNLDKDGRLYLEKSSRIIIKNLTEGGLAANGTVVYRATFDVDGVLRLYSHQIGLNGSKTSPLIVWPAIKEEDRCMVKGICGLNSYCAFNGASISCYCPPGFDFLNPDRPSMGCKLGFGQKEDCLGTKVNVNYTISTLENIMWEPDEYAVIWPSEEEDCQQACLEDCYCKVALFKDGRCEKQKLPLRFGIRSSSKLIKSLIKIRVGSLSTDPSPDNRIVIKKIKKNLGKEVLIVGVVLVSISLIIFVCFGYLIYSHRIWRYEMISKLGSSPDYVEEINLRPFSYYELVKATDNFKEELGRGAFGRVYKGSLPNMGGREIAVKKLEKLVEDGEREFRTEMKVIGRTHHRNLVRLLGFCSEGSNRLLVYEYMKNGSLAELLFESEQHPNWSERERFSQEIARGILYLHEECETHIVHCDIKPHNILMDEAWTAKISDFGLAKLLMPDQTKTFTEPRGTRGYAAPEWHKSLPITVKADVYSFGILFFEIICCRKKVDISVPDEEIILLDWVYTCYENGELGKLVGSDVVEAAALKKMVEVGLWCVQTEPDLRPSMKQVVLMLEGIVSTPPPPSRDSSSHG